MARLEKLSEETGVKDWTTDGDSLLQNNDYQVYFDAQTIEMRYASLKKSIAAGNHIYCEKPVAISTNEVLEPYHPSNSSFDAVPQSIFFADNQDGY